MPNQLTEMIHDTAYEAIKTSELGQSMTNAQRDSVSDDLAIEIAKTIDQFFLERGEIAGLEEKLLEAKCQRLMKQTEHLEPIGRAA
jgi:hypothetical protein